MKAVSVACYPGPPLELYVVDTEGRLWVGRGRAGHAHPQWEEIALPVVSSNSTLEAA